MLLGSLQDSLLVLLTFDADHAPLIRGAVEPEMYGGPYRVIATRIYDYLDKFKKPPADHLPDLLADKLEAKTRGEAALYTEIIENIHEAKARVNAAFTMAQLETFAKRQALRTIAVDFGKALQRDTEESLEEAEALLAKASVQSLKVFDPGTRLSDPKRALRFLNGGGNSFPTGVTDLDKRGFGPTRKELWLFIANTKAGKTWALTQLAKMAAIHRMRVVHVSLEMGEEKVTQRYFQTFFAMAKRNDPIVIQKFQKDTLGRISGFDDLRLKPALALDDPHIRKKLEFKIKRWRSRMLDNVVVKQFPTGQLTVHQLAAYLDNLSISEQFSPDLLVLDYPDLMKLDPTNMRLDLDTTMKALRGMAVERNIALAAVSQSHRGAARAKLVRADNVAEAYSKIAHADTVVTYTQTQAEHRLGLARLHVAAGRNDADKFTIVISQNYAMGAFVVDSALMAGANYWGLVPQDDEE